MQSIGKTDPQTDIYRRQTSWQRIASASQLYFFAREIIKGRIKRANPNISEAELEKKIRTYF
ncbi:MAG: hypothetical protein V2A66_02000 [Pseudomonadota bacterium]